MDLKNNEQVLNKFNEFATERDWSKFHTIKNLACALSVETSELLELFQWEDDDVIQSWVDKNGAKRQNIADELADIYMYLIKLASLVGVDIFETIEQKMKKNAKKYPVEKSKGHARKYTEL